MVLDLPKTLLLFAVFAFGCVQAKPAPRLAQPAKVRAAYVLTYADKAEVAGVPDAVSAAISESLGARNMQPIAADIAALAQPFSRKRATADRLELLAEQATTAGEPFVLLVETTPRYYSLLSGRYRWDVDLRVTLAPTTALTQAQSQDWEITAFLDFGHQDHVDALTYSAMPIADRVARLVDQFLSGYDGAPLAQVADSAAKASASHPLAAGSAIYFVMVDRFSNGDPANDNVVDISDPHGFHGGDLQGLTSKLDWIQKLGITTVWLSPVFAMRDQKFHGHGAFHGYWVEDFGAIEPRFGGEAALAELGAALEARKMSMFLDVVLNHVAMDGQLLKDKPQWFHNLGGITDWSDPIQILTHDVHGLPDLAQENPEVAAHLLRHSLKWLDVAQPAGFRLDAVKHVPPAFWTSYNADVKAHARPGFVMLGEDLDGDPARVAQTMRTGNFDAMFDFPLHFALVDVFCGDAHPGRLASTLFADRLYPKSVGERREGLVTLLDNHDLPRILSACGNDEQRVMNALRFMLTARGTPSFTWGTESGALGLTEPDNRADMRFDEHPVGTAMRRWLKLRRETATLTDGRDVLLTLGPTSFTYARIGRKQTVIVALNTTKAPMALELPAAQWRNLETDATTDAPVAAPGVTAWIAPVRLPIPAKDLTVEFRVSGAPAGELRIVGSGPELGNWDPAQAPRAAAIKLPAGGAFAYKPVVMTPGGPVWGGGDNRYVLVQDALVDTSFADSQPRSKKPAG